jgi:hypothetical protein
LFLESCTIEQCFSKFEKRDTRKGSLLLENKQFYFRRTG